MTDSSVPDPLLTASSPYLALETWLDTLPLPILLKKESGEILYQNRLWCEKIGNFSPLSPESLPSIFLRSPTLPETDANNFEDFRAYSEWQSSKKADYIDFCPSQSLFPQHRWQFLYFPYLGLSLQQKTVLIIALDITEQQQDFRTLEAQNADLLQLNRLKDEFLDFISHELKSPLTAVVGLSSLLQDRRVGPLNAAQERYANLIYRSSRQLMVLVNNLLDLTRLENGQLQLNSHSIDVPSLCQQAYQNLRNNNPESDLPDFILEIDNHETLIADEQRLQQMLSVLLENAAKLSQNDGKIGIRVKGCPRWVTFTVWDTGEGIPEDIQSSLLQHGQSPNPCLNAHYPQVGLGLILTQRLARAHGGDLSFRSKMGQGSQFTLLLPVQNQEYSASASSKRQPLVLVVETLPHWIEDLTDKLSELGNQVVIARTGTEALEKARQLKPDIIFLNPWLPLLSGWDVLTLLKSDVQTQQIRIILTDYQTDSSLKTYQADAILSLPSDLEVLKRLLNENKEGKSLENPLSNPSLTLLFLHPDSDTFQGSTLTPQDLALINQLSKQNHRILQADDLEQASLLVSVWDVDVVVLDGHKLKHKNDYLRIFATLPELATLPLVTLDKATTKLANRLPSLRVFPCLDPDGQEALSQLWQVVQIAAKMP